jgi:predicted O-methyltransferase YrrM
VANGFGDLTTLEVNPEAHATAQAQIAHYGLEAVVDSRLASSLEFTPDRHYDMAIFDTGTELQIQEFRRFKPWLKPGALLIFRDTSERDGATVPSVRTLIAEGAIEGVNLPTPRGVWIGRVR